MDRELKTKIKNARKLDSLITKNRHEIEHILVSELFLHQLMDVADHIDVEIIPEGDKEVLYIFGKPINMSRFINEGCILVLKNDEYVVLKGI